MNDESLHVHSEVELRAYVHATLCAEAGLDAQQFQLVERDLVRRNRPCGRIFHLHGPRRMQLSAVWDADAGTVYFYNSAGNRFLRVTLAPPARKAA